MLAIEVNDVGLGPDSARLGDRPVSSGKVKNRAVPRVQPVHGRNPSYQGNTAGEVPAFLRRPPQRCAGCDPACPAIKEPWTPAHFSFKGGRIDHVLRVL